MNNKKSEDSKGLIIFKKNILLVIKEKLEDKKQELMENNIDPKWLAAFQEANKDFELIKPIEINLDEDSTNTLNIPYSKEDNNSYQEIKEEDITGFENITEKKEPVLENKINSSEELKEIYEKVKNNELDLKTFSGPDLLKIYSVILHELEMKKDVFNEEDFEEYEEIKRIEIENKILQEEINKLENNSDN